MELEVKVTQADVTDVVGVAVNWADEQIGQTTLGDVLVDALLAKLASDPRWDSVAERFWDAVDEYMRETAPRAVQALVEAEVARQLAKTEATASVRGKPSTRAEAMIATEVTTQLRCQFQPLVEAALTRLDGELRKVADELLRQTVAQHYGSWVAPEAADGTV